MTPTEIIRSACIKANPEIVELKFGCEINAINREEASKLDLTTGYVISEDFSIMDCFESKGHRELETSFIHYNKDKMFEIIGRPIRLADVLLAIGKDEKDIYFKNSDTTIPKWRIIHSDVTGSSTGWSLSHDDLNDQSDECKAFLAELLSEQIVK